MSERLAKDYFSTWYQGAKKTDIQEEDLTNIQKAITSLLKIKDKQLWLDMFRLSYSQEPDSVDNKNKIITTISNCKTNFPLENNENELQVIAGCAVPQFIELGNSFVCDALSVAHSTFPYCRDDLTLRIEDSKAIVKNFWKEKAIKQRNVGKLRSINQIKSETTPTITDLLPIVNQLVRNNEILKDSLKVVTEESDALWWVFGGFSSSSVHYSELSTEQAVIQIAIDLADLTKSEPGLINITELVKKCYSEHKSSVNEKITLYQILKGLSEENVTDLVDRHNEETSDITPMLTSIKQFSEGHEVKSIASVLNKKGVNIKKRLYPSEHTEQLYLELMFGRCYSDKL